MTENKKGGYTPRHLQKQGAFNFRLTERDAEIMKAVNRCRYLRTQQIKKLVFGENKSRQSCQKRLKYLYHAKFLGRITPLIHPGLGNADAAYYLDKEGAEYLASLGETPYNYNKSGEVKHIFLNHALDLSEFRINLELALKDFPMLRVHRFVCDFEVKAHMNAALGMKRFKLWQQLTHPLSRQNYVVYPDAQIILRVEAGDAQKLYFLEIDRGTESLNTIRNKVIGYNLYHAQKVFKKFGKFEDFRVLIQTTSEKRAKNMRKALTDLEGSGLVWITSSGKVSEDTVLKEAIWVDSQWREMAVLKI